MLKRLKLINFKSHRNSEFLFDDSRLHALVGQNSTGKTSVLQAIHYCHRLETSELAPKEVFIDQSSPEYIITTGEDVVNVIITGENSNDKLRLRELGSDKDPPTWMATYSYNLKSRLSGFTASWRKEIPNRIELAPHEITSQSYLKLTTNNLAKPAYSGQITPKLEFDGTGLAPCLDYLKNEFPDNFDSLQERLKQIVPTVKRISIRRAKVPNVDHQFTSLGVENQITMPLIVGQEIFLDMRSGDRIPAHALSEGTVLALGLLTVLHYPEKPSLLLLDDIEQGLHPKAQRDLMAVLKNIIQGSPDLQIIFSTHSPYIVDELEPSQVHVLSNTASGFSRCKRLDEHPDIEWAKHSLTTGEFWNAEGEEWVLAGESDD